MLIVGLEDGTVGVMDLTASNGKSYKRPIFKMQGDDDEKGQDNSHAQFTEISSEHEDSIVSVEVNMATASGDNARLISVSMDGSLYLWKLQ